MRLRHITPPENLMRQVPINEQGQAGVPEFDLES